MDQAVKVLNKSIDSDTKQMGVANIILDTPILGIEVDQSNSNKFKTLVATEIKQLKLVCKQNQANHL
jgi:hypothetical protein